MLGLYGVASICWQHFDSDVSLPKRGKNSCFVWLSSQFSCYLLFSDRLNKANTASKNEMNEVPTRIKFA